MPLLEVAHLVKEFAAARGLLAHARRSSAPSTT